MQEDSDFSVKYVLCMRHTVVLILTGTCVLRPVSTATVPTQINMLHVALIPQLLVRGALDSPNGRYLKWTTYRLYISPSLPLSI